MTATQHHLQMVNRVPPMAADRRLMMNCVPHQESRAPAWALALEAPQITIQAL